MPGFMFTVTSNNKYWYLAGAIIFLLVGIGVAAGGFLGGSTVTGITGIVIGLVAVIFLIDAIMNL